MTNSGVSRRAGLGAAILTACGAVAIAAGLGVRVLTSVPLAAAAAPVTFTKHVAPLLQAKCQSCHHDGTVAPMSLTTYEEVRPSARSIKDRVVRREMPPWHLDKTVGIQKFKDDISLTDGQIATISAWVDCGAVMGDPRDMPAPRTFRDDERTIGKPDLIVSLPKEDV